MLSTRLRPAPAAALPPRGELPAVTEPAPAEDPSWAQLWFALLRQRWSTLVVVPADASLDVSAVARTLADVGRRYQGQAVELVDATGAQPYEIAAVVAAARDAAAGGAHVVVGVGFPLANPTAIAIARALDTAVLAVPVGRASLSDARRTIEAVGREQFVGSVAVRADVRADVRTDAVARADRARRR